MAGAEAAVQRVIVDKPCIPSRLVRGSKFLKWPNPDGPVSYISLYFYNYVDL